jgi:hypothetical protein
MHAPDCDCGPGDMFCCHFPLPRPRASTLPPARPDHETQAFETLIKKVGEGRARWSHLLELLESETT